MPHTTDAYAYLRRHRPDLLRAAVEAGSIVSCAPVYDDWNQTWDQYRQQLAAQVEAKVAEVLAGVLREPSCDASPHPRCARPNCPEQIGVEVCPMCARLRSEDRAAEQAG